MQDKLTIYRGIHLSLSLIDQQSVVGGSVP